MDRIIGELRLTDLTLTQALAALGRHSGVTMQIEVSSQPYEATLHLRHVSVKEALELIIETWLRHPDGVRWQVEGGRVRVVDASVLAAEPVTRVYDVTDLLAEAVATERQLGSPEHVSVDPAGLFATGNAGAAKVPLRRVVRGHLEHAVMGAVGDAAWWGQYGGAGRIGWAGDRLVVIQDRESHRQIERLLHLLRLSRRAPPPPGHEAPIHLLDGRSLHVLAPVWFATGQLVPRQPAALERRILRFEAKDRPLRQVIEDIAAMAGVTISVDWPSLEREGVEAGASVSVSLRNATLAAALDRVLAPLNNWSLRLACEVDGLVLRIAGVEDLKRRHVFRVYDVRGIMADAAGWSRRIADRTGGPAPVVSDHVAQLNHLLYERNFLIRRSRFCQYWGGLLIVSDSPDGHRRIASMLHSMARCP
jgi:hypothetical protein